MPENTLPTWPPGVQELRLGPLTIDLRYRRVSSPAGTVELSQRPFDLLCLFLAEPRVLHTRSALFTRVWKGVVVEDANLSQSVWLVRNALGDAKPWLRTVAKSGYVFEPPVELELASETSPDVAAVPPDLVPDPKPEPEAPIAAPAAPVARRRYGRWLGAALALIALAAGAAWLVRGEPTTTTPARIVLVDLDGTEDVAAQQHWSLSLLHAWIEWRLSSEPDAVVIDAPRLGRTKQPGPLQVVLLSAQADPADGTKLRLMAHVTIDGATRSFGGTGALADVAPRIDAISRELVPALVRRPVALDTPPLDLGVEAAKHYADALASRAARRTIDAIAAFDAVIAAAPGFGLAAAQQAVLLGELGRMRLARERFGQAAPWIARMPPAARQIAQAQQLMAERDFRAGAKAYAALLAQYPAQPLYVLEEARALVADRRIHEALGVLSTLDWEAQPASMLVGALIVRATALWDVDGRAQAKADALRADAIAARNGWPRQRGQALFIVAQVAMSESAPDIEALMEDAARQFDLAGDRFSALRARIQGDVRRSGSDDTRFKALVEEARSAGFTYLEVYALRSEALRRLFRGEPAPATALLRQGAEVARAADDMDFPPTLPYELLQAVFFGYDYDAFDRALAGIDLDAVQGDWRTGIGQLIASVDFRRGRFDAADAALLRYSTAEGVQPAGDGSEVAFGCIQAELALRRGKIPDARSAAERCGANGRATGPVARDLVNARLAALGGDRPAALRGLDAADAALEAMRDDVNRWGLEVLATQLRLYAGDADGAAASLAGLRERLAQVEMPALRADLLLASTEAALAQGRLDEARRWLAEARTRMPAGDWVADSRARIDEAVLAFRTGKPDALEALRPLVVEARERGDLLTALAVLSLPSPRGEETAEVVELRTRTGLRTDDLRWLLGERH